MIGTLFLSGGGNEQQSYQLDHAFVAALKSTRRILYLPFALDRSMRGFEACYDWITSTLNAHSDEFIDITMWLDVSNKKLSDLHKFDALYIGGGNTYKLLSILKETHFDQVLKQYFLKGGIIYGGSAGAIIFGKSIRTVSEENNLEYKHERGLHLLGEYSLRCHYIPSEMTSLHHLGVREQMDILALPEDAGLIFHQRALRVVGAGIVSFKQRENETCAFTDGQSIPLDV